MPLTDHGATTSEVPGAGRFLVEGVYALVFVVTIIGWAAAGFLVWVPLLVRTTTIFAAVIFYATLFRDQERVRRAEAGVHFAIRFYAQGFRHFFRFYHERHAPEPVGGILNPISEMKWKEMLVECGWIGFFWGFVLVIL